MLRNPEGDATGAGGGGGGGGNLIDNIKLQVVATADNTGLDQNLAKLHAIQAALKSINQMASGVNIQSRPAPVMEDIIKQMRAKIPKGKELLMKDVAEHLGMDPATIRAAFVLAEKEYKDGIDKLNQQQSNLKKSKTMMDKQAKKSGTALTPDVTADYAQRFSKIKDNLEKEQTKLKALHQGFTNRSQGEGMTIGSAGLAAKFFSAREAEMNKASGAFFQRLPATVTHTTELTEPNKPTPVKVTEAVQVEPKPTVGTPQPAPAAVIAGKDTIGLTVPTTQILATLGPGEIHLNVPATQVTATPAGTTPNAAVPPSVPTTTPPAAVAPPPPAPAVASQFKVNIEKAEPVATRGKRKDETNWRPLPSKTFETFEQAAEHVDSISAYKAKDSRVSIREVDPQGKVLNETKTKLKEHREQHGPIVEAPKANPPPVPPVTQQPAWTSQPAKSPAEIDALKAQLKKEAQTLKEYRQERGEYKDSVRVFKKKNPNQPLPAGWEDQEAKSQKVTTDKAAEVKALREQLASSQQPASPPPVPPKGTPVTWQYGKKPKTGEFLSVNPVNKTWIVGAGSETHMVDPSKVLKVAQPAAPPAQSQALAPAQTTTEKPSVTPTPQTQPSAPPAAPPPPPPTTTAAPAGAPPPPPPKPEAKPGTGLINLTVPVSQIHAELGLGMITLMVDPARVKAAPGDPAKPNVGTPSGTPPPAGSGGAGGSGSGGGGGTTTSGSAEEPSGGGRKRRKRKSSDGTVGPTILSKGIKPTPQEEQVVFDEEGKPVQRSVKEGVGIGETRKTVSTPDETGQMVPVKTVETVNQQKKQKTAQDQLVANTQAIFDLRKKQDEARRRDDMATEAQAKAELKTLTAQQRQLRSTIKQIDRDTAANLRQETAEKKRATSVNSTLARKDALAAEKIRLAQEAEARRLQTHTETSAAETAFQASGAKWVKTDKPNALHPGSPETRTYARTDPDGSVKQMAFSYGKAEASARELSKAQVMVQGATAGAGAEFLKHIATAATWIASYGVMHQAVQLVRTSLEKLIEVGPQVARLEQVFKGVGGTATQLAVDTMGLAAANGAEVHQAMEAAIQWSRLGLTRVQVNEAVRVSLMAANVAQIDALEATEALQGVMQAYGLSVGELRGELGQIVQISNSYNVTNKDMLTGLTRVAAVAKQAGLPLAELQGLLGATIGGTAQSGANIGNMMKSVILALSNPELQEKLRLRFRFEPTTGGEEIKDMSRMLSDVFVKFHNLNQLQRQSFLFTTAGRTQASRLEAMLEGYVKAQYLAVNAQLHLNTAEQENEKIVAALKTQLHGLSAEWERFVFIQGNRGPVQVMQEFGTSLRNVLKLMNSPVGSPLSTGIMGLLAAGGIKTLLTGMNLKSGGGAVGSMGGHIRSGMESLNNSMVALYANTMGGAASGGKLRGVHEPDAMYALRSKARGLPGMGGIAGSVMTSPLGLGSPTQMYVWSEAMMRVGRSSAIASTGIKAMFTVAGTATRVLGAGIIALQGWIAPLAAVYGGIKLFNMGMEWMGMSSETLEKHLAGVNEKAQAAKAAANAYAEAAQTLQTVGRSLIPDQGFSGMKSDEMAKYVSQASQLVGLWEPDLTKQQELQRIFASQTAELLKQGDIMGVRNLLDAEASKYATKRFEKLQEEYASMETQRIGKLSRIQELDTINKSWRGGFGREGRDKEANRLRGEVSGLESGKFRNMGEQNDTFEQAFQYSEKWQKELKTQEQLWKSIGEIYQTIKTDDPMSRAQLDIAALEAKNKAITEHIELLKQQNDADQEGKEERGTKIKALSDRAETLRKEIGQIATLAKTWGEDVPAGVTPIPLAKGERQPILHTENPTAAIQQRQGELATIQPQIEHGGAIPGSEYAKREEMRMHDIMEMAKNNREIAAQTRNLPISKLESNLKFGREQAPRETAPFAVGYNETQKLQNEQQAIRQRIAELAGKSNRTEEETAILAEDRNRLLQNEIQLWNRKGELLKEQKQLQYDMNREMMHSIMGAGPAEMLRKLAALRMGSGGKMGMGQYLSLSPGMREDINMVDPRFNRQGMELRREQFQSQQRGPQNFTEFEKEYKRGLETLKKSFGDYSEMLKKARPTEAKTPETYNAQVMNVTANSISVQAQQATITVSEKTLADVIGRYLSAHQEPVKAVGMAPSIAGAGGSGGGAEH